MATCHHSAAHDAAPQNYDTMTRDDWLGLLALAAPFVVYLTILIIGVVSGAFASGWEA